MKRYIFKGGRRPKPARPTMPDVPWWRRAKRALTGPGAPTLHHDLAERYNTQTGEWEKFAIIV